MLFASLLIKKQKQLYKDAKKQKYTQQKKSLTHLNKYEYCGSSSAPIQYIVLTPFHACVIKIEKYFL